MAKSIWPIIEARKDDILQWTTDGMTSVEICKKLGISNAAFWHNLQVHQEFRQAFEKAQRKPDEKVEAALYKLCIGHTITEKKREQKMVDGEKVWFETITEKEVSPNNGAIQFWLTNRMKDRWVRQPEVVAAVSSDSGVVLMPAINEGALNECTVDTTT